MDVSDVTQTEDVMRAAVMAVSQEESIYRPVKTLRRLNLCKFVYI